MATLMPATWRVASPAEGGKASGTSLLARARGLSHRPNAARPYTGATFTTLLRLRLSMTPARLYASGIRQSCCLVCYGTDRPSLPKAISTV